MAFGEVSALFSDPRSCTVVASSVCELYVLHARELHKRLSWFPVLTHDLVHAALDRRLAWLDKNRNYDDIYPNTFNSNADGNDEITINNISRKNEDNAQRSGLELPSLLALVPCFTHTTERMRYAISECAKSYTLPANHVLVSMDM